MSNATINYRSLAVSERLELVADIWDSIAEETNAVALEVSAEERHEFHRRLAAHEADPASSLPWAAVRGQLLPHLSNRHLAASPEVASRSKAR